LLISGEFVLLELMRLGATDRKQIERIRIKFQELDIKKNNVLDYDELCQGGYLIQTKSKASSHFLSRTKSGTELVHLAPPTSSPFFSQPNRDEGEEGIVVPNQVLSNLPEGEEEEDEEDQQVLQEVLQEIQQMQRVRSASIARLSEGQDLMLFDETLLNYNPTRRGSRLSTSGDHTVNDQIKEDEEEYHHPVEV
jgi:hypothetical protein